MDEQTDVLHADLALRNAGQYAVDGPLLVGITNLSDPAVLVRDFDGLTSDQIPYFEITSLPDGKTLQPGETSGARSVVGVAVGDFTGSGDLSVVTANPGDQVISLAAADGTGDYAPATST